MNHDAFDSDLQRSPSLMGAMMSFSDLESTLVSPRMSFQHDEKSSQAGASGAGGRGRSLHDPQAGFLPPRDDISKHMGGRAYSWKGATNRDSSQSHPRDHPDNQHLHDQVIVENLDPAQKEARTSHYAHTSSAPAKRHGIIVDWETPSDPARPYNWSLFRKVFFGLTTGLALMAVVFSSAVFTPLSPLLSSSEYLRTPTTAMHLSVSLFLLGFCVGCPVMARMSRSSGHRAALGISMLGFSIFQVPVGLANLAGALLFMRFMAGVCGAGVLVVVPVAWVEVFAGDSKTRRSLVMTILMMCIVLGATIAPVAGAYLIEGDRGGPSQWPWAAWTSLILGGCAAIATLFGAVRESSSDVLLRRKAKQLRAQTGDWAIHARCEEVGGHKSASILNDHVANPLRILVRDPILAAMTVYLSLVYGILYLVLQIFPLTFQQVHGWRVSNSSLSLVAVVLGVLVGGGTVAIFAATWCKTKRARSRHSGSSVAPEAAWLPPMLLGSVLLPAALFWFAWTPARAHWASQLVASFFVGLGIMIVLACGTLYLCDMFGYLGTPAEDAIGAHIVVRSLVAASFPLWGGAMFESVGPAWSSTVLALISAVMISVPIVLVVYGARIRNRRQQNHNTDSGEISFVHVQ